MPAHIGALVTIGNMPSTGRRPPGTCARQPVLAALFGLLLINRPPGGLSGRAKSAFTPVPSGIQTEIATPNAAGYKLSFSGGFLFRAAGSAGVQSVIFAGVFVPQVWNQQGHQSASRLCPAGVWLRLYHALPASFIRFDSLCEFMYTSRTSPKDPKFPCTERRRLQGPPFGTLHPGLPTARLNYSQDDTVHFDKTVAYRCAKCSGVSGTPHSSPPSQAQVRTSVPSIDSPMNPLTRAYLQPLGSLKLIFSAGIRTARQATPPLTS